MLNMKSKLMYSNIIICDCKHKWEDVIIVALIWKFNIHKKLTPNRVK